MPDKEKSAEILGVLRAFLTQYGANLRLFQALLPYGVLPKVDGFFVLTGYTGGGLK